MKTEDLQRFARVARWVHCPPGQYLYAEGRTPASLIIVVSGLVNSCTHELNGQMVIEAVAGSGDSIGWLSLVDAGERATSAIAVEQSSCLVIDSRDMYAILDTCPHIWCYVAQVLAARLRQQKNSRRAIVAFSLEQRIACLLMDQLRHGDGVAPRGIALSQQEIANLVVASRQSVNKCLRQWADAGIVKTEYRKLMVLRTDTIEQLARSG